MMQVALRSKEWHEVEAEVADWERVRKELIFMRH